MMSRVEEQFHNVTAKSARIRERSYCTITWGDFMKGKMVQILVPLCAVILLPTLVLPLTKRKEVKPLDTYIQVTETGAPETESQISVCMQDGSVQNMNLDEYLTGVVLAEMPAQFQDEALKAQAVVARTYTMKRSISKSKHAGSTVCTDPSCCQAYCSPEEYLSRGNSEEFVEKIKLAVQATRGEVLTFEGEYIEATYFACSGGRTESAVAVWGDQIPYLQAVDSPGEENANHYTDTVTFGKKEFAAALGIHEGELSGQWLRGISYTDGGGVEYIHIGNKEFAGTAVRSALGLRSTAFVLTVLGDTVTITTKGYGHRVGMSQQGAQAMALEGKTYDEILSHYYQGVVLDTISTN